jgi:alkylation response protein AidB-like acyl-CoA dehydrogenase
LRIKESVTNTLTFDNVEIPTENIIGEEGRGFLVAMRTLDAGRLGLGASKELLKISTKILKTKNSVWQANC